ncbi:MAG: hypothetical protein OXR03_13585 [Rhodospirillaceae bacterium]|nr:hypothetical protein [Rhodospirillaceae bacterium]
MNDMHDGAQGIPMTEIALALAMGFFSIMVLTIISMGAAPQKGQAVAAAMLAPSSNETSAVAVESEDTVVIYYRGRFLDAQMKPVDPATVKTRGRLILAIDPGLPLGEAMAAREKVASDRLVVSTLNKEWLRALQGETQ